MAYTVRLIVVFAVAFSLPSVTGPMFSHFRLPTVHLAHALPQNCSITVGNTCSEYWVPAGPAMDTFQGTIFNDAQSEFTNIMSASPSIDLTDVALTADLTPGFTTSNNFRITSPAPGGFAEIEFMLANNFWGVDFNSGNNANGTLIRQGIAHMIDTALFAANEPALAGQAMATDNPEAENSLLSANPCSWDSLFPESGSNCIVGSPGGTAYHIASATGVNGISWLQAPGSVDLNAAAQHFINAGIASGGYNTFTSVMTLTSADQTTALAHVPNFFIRNDNPTLLHLGDSIAEQICYLFTGAYSIPCPYLSVTHGPITAFPGLTTSTTSPNLSWGMYTSGIATSGAIGDPGFGGSDYAPKRDGKSSGDPFDTTLYFAFNSQFASDIPSNQPPNGYCSSSGVPTVSAANYIYLCNTTYDSLSNQMEFAPCLTVTGDPTPGSTSNISTGHCPGTPSALSAIGAAIQAEDNFGSRAFTIPIYTKNNEYGYLNNGFTRVINSLGGGLPNFFEHLDAYNPSAPLPGTIRQGFSQSTNTLSPYVANTAWDAMIVGNLYSSLIIGNPLGDNSIDWMALSVQQLGNPSLTYAPPAGTSQTFRFTLRSDMFFQDRDKVTSFDVAFSYLSLAASGAFQSGGLASMTGITVLGPSQLDINMKSVGPFTLQAVSGPTILPGTWWTNVQLNTWRNDKSGCMVSGASCYPAQYTLGAPSNGVPLVNCTPTLSCSFPAADMNVAPTKLVAGFDPLAAKILIGSGPWTCGIVTVLGGSTSCSSTGTMNPPSGGSYVLSRFGKGLAPASSVSGIYFRSNGNLAAYLWSQDTGDITHDFLNFSVVASCFGAAVTSTGPCAHFQRGIGANGGPISVGLSQVAIVNRFVGLNWVAPFNWVSSPPVGIIPLAPVLYENTITLKPSSVAGCTIPYPNGGYDC
jgi:hypothetical protein